MSEIGRLLLIRWISTTVEVNHVGRRSQHEPDATSLLSEHHDHESQAAKSLIGTSRFVRSSAPWKRKT